MTLSITLTTKISSAATKKKCYSPLTIGYKKNKAANYFKIDEKIVERNRIVGYSRIKHGIKSANSNLLNVSFSIKK